eukprot:CAMPEP_0198281010 /NCGR_PEP_ID=MMETSP1449-20131203/1035_1 /TAXON_ID=420275 /ORGANISM="Attheya septentrionalis, Strain CCMP2084" /LENGTH=725 /DNA_ID=CAMNT_0043976623 /DNA_START=130 /DNA_END=2307 /DNA_ORIENTATION=+
MAESESGSESQPPSQRVVVFGSSGQGSSAHSSTRSFGSGVRTPGGSFRKIQTPTPSLRENLMRTIKRDPFVDYEIVEVMGVGSMGSVSKVKKRGHKLGGSARKSVGGSSKTLAKLPLVGKFFKEKTLSRANGHGSTIYSEQSFDSTFSEGSGSADLTSSQRTPPGYISRKEGGLSVDKSKSSATYEVYYALKSIHLNRVTDVSFIQELENEIVILRSLDHPHIVRPIETFLHRRQLFVVMELCSGGDLYSRDPYTEVEAARIIGNVLSAIAFMHSKNVTHRDLKYENIMFANSSPNSEVKLIDFGLSKKYGPEDPHLNDGVGTIYTMAPEVLKGNYTFQADIWSLGVISFMLLSSQMPFYGRKRRHVVEKIMTCTYEFKGRRWRSISDTAKEFVTDLLQLDQLERPSADEALRATWLNRRLSATIRTPTDSNTMDEVQATIEHYSQYSKLKKIALMVVAHKSTSEEIGFLRKMFEKFDQKMDGTISLDEFKVGLNGYGYTEDQMEDMFDGVDLDGTGNIRYTEFLAATIEAHGVINEERLAEAFDRLDSDDSGYISTQNLREVLGQELSKEDIGEIIKEVDLTRDGKISYREFLALWDIQQEEKREAILHQISTRKSSSSSISSPLLTARSIATGVVPGLPPPLDLNAGSDSAMILDGDMLAHAQFFQEKNISERRVAKAHQLDPDALQAKLKKVAAERPPLNLEKVEKTSSKVTKSFPNIPRPP